MISLKLGIACAVFLTSLIQISAFDANRCDVYVFRTSEGALWHCGEKLPADESSSKSMYCDHSHNDGTHPFAWASDHPDDWCDFMVATVRQANEDHHPLTPFIDLEDTPSPNVWFFTTLVDWGCYVVENGITTESYLVDSQNGQHASTTTEQCVRDMNYFDYWNLYEGIRDTTWWGHVPDLSYQPHRSSWGRCHYDDSMKGPNYDPSLGVIYAECDPGFVCELKYQDYAACFPDPHADHECCVSWNNKCDKEGDCCAGSECNASGYCEVGLPQVYEDPPGICASREIKEDKSLHSRCYDYESGGQGDCADGYKCEGSWWYAQCEIDETVKNDCCKWNWDNSNPRPGDCCVGWYAHCHEMKDGKCIDSQCVPGRETGVDESGNSMVDVHDRLCTDIPVIATFNEKIDKCIGAVCGVWGDPHIITCDELHYDCQAVGLFTLMKNHMFNVQAYFKFVQAPWGGASVTNDLAIDYIKGYPNDVPTMQFSFPNFENIDQNNPVYDAKSRVIGVCPILFYLDGELIDISDVPDNGYLYGTANSDHSVKLTGQNQIDIQHMVGVDQSGEPYYSTTVIWIEGSPFTDMSCLLTYFICLPRVEEEQFKESSLGLLGTPNGSTSDDWMGKDGQTLLLPDYDRSKASFDYCLDNWCVPEDESIVAYEIGSSYEDYMCDDQEYYEFDIDKCPNKDQIIQDCSDSLQPIACQMEKCIGNPIVDEEIDIIEDIVDNGDDDLNFVEFPDSNDEDYGDCANLGSGLSGSTGTGAYSLSYPNIESIFNGGGFSIGYDNSVSVLVGGNFNCKRGAGFEGRGVFLGDMTLEEQGCERLAATGHGSKIHPPENNICIEVGGDVKIDSSFAHSHYIMYENENTNKACHMVYKEGCTINGDECPNSRSELIDDFIFTNGEVKQIPNLDLTRWNDEITLLRQKTSFWNTLKTNGVTEMIDNHLHLKAGPDNNLVQVFEIDTIVLGTTGVTFEKSLNGKTILIRVTGDGEFYVPQMCFHPVDAIPGDASICNIDTFPTELTGSIAWVFTTTGSIELSGDNEMQGSVVVPNGDLTISTIGHSGRLIVGGDLTMDGPFTELHNYEFDPVSRPLPLGDLEEICEVAPPPVCEETYKTLTSETVCPSKPEGIVKLIKSSVDLPDDEPIIYDIILDPPRDANSAHTVKFKVDSPYTNYTDIYVKHAKKVGKHALDPICESMPFTAGCALEAPIIEVGCHEYDGVNPFALVSIYFASNTDSMLLDIGSGGDVTIDKCCKPPEEYEEGYGVAAFSFEIQCVCPDSVASS